MGENTTGVPRQYLGKVKAAEALDLSPNGLWWRRNHAEGWYRRAAEAGDHDAAVVLGVLLHARGELAGAEAWLERAAAAGHRDAEIGLGFLCHRLGRTSTAEGWYRRAAEAGDHDAAVVLGVLLHARGELAGAEAWLERAAAAGHCDADHALHDADSPWTMPYRLGRIRDAHAGEQPSSIPPMPAVLIQERKKGYSGWREDDLQQRDKASPVRIAQPETWIGVTAVADLLSRSHERVRALVKTPEFPPKAGELKESKLLRPGWRVDAIQSYAQHRNTQPGQAGWRSRRQPSPTRQDAGQAASPTVR